MTAVSPCDLLDEPELRSILAAALERAGGDARIRSLERQPSPYASTSPVEIVDVGFENGPDLRLLVKYEQGDNRTAYGSRRGVAYEGSVYEHVLSRMGMGTVPFFGLHATTTPLGRCILLGYCGDGVRMTRVPQPEAALLAAAEWIGRFHARAEEELPRLGTAAVAVYDEEYYRRWPARVIDFLNGNRDASWLADLCGMAADILPDLTDDHVTIVHGEYYPANILFCPEGSIVPIDWESAAVAAGEIDLVTLTENWPSEVASKCEQAYAQARWHGERPPSYGRRLALARLYVELRWLGESVEYFRNGDKYIERLRVHARQFGIA